MAERDLPAGYVRFRVDRCEVVCMPHVADAVRTALGAGTLYRFAETHAAARPLTGRGTAYALPLPGDVERVVVRHNRHGGLVAPLTGDLFRPPTRAPLELRTSTLLRDAGVPTPVILGYVIYDAPAGFRRADVMSREIPNSFDLAVALMSSERSGRSRALDASARLISLLSRAKARHHDLNAKNVLLHDGPHGSLEAMVLDVDRVELVGDPAHAQEANLARLLRSARKWQRNHGAPVTEQELDELVTRVRESQSALASARS